MKKYVTTTVLAAIAVTGLLVRAAQPAPGAGQKSAPEAKSEKPALKVAEPAAKKITPETPNGEVINAAKLALGDVERAENDVLKSFTELRRRLEKFNPSAQSEKESIDAFRAFLDTMQVHGARLLDMEPEFKISVRKYDKALEKAPGEFRRASERYAKMAAAESFEDLQKNYGEMAKAAQETALDLEKRRGDLAINSAKVASSLAWVRHALRLLDAMGAYLDLIPEPSKAAEIARFAQSLERFSASFRAATESFRELHDRRLGAPPTQLPIVPQPAGSDQKSTR